MMKMKLEKKQKKIQKKGKKVPNQTQKQVIPRKLN